MIGMKIEGLSEMKVDTDKLAQKMYEYNEKATEQNMRAVKKAAVRNAPYKTGTLRRSIAHVFTVRSPSRGLVSGEVGSDLPYARITELGGTILPVNKKVLAWKDPDSDYANKDGWVIARKVVRAAQPYLFPALVSTFQTNLNRYKQAWKAAMGESIITEEGE